MKYVDDIYWKMRYRVLQGKIEKSILNRRKGQKIKVAFYVVFDSIFQFEILYNMMRQNLQVEAYILVIPDIVHGEKNTWNQMEKTYTSLTGKGYRVYSAYDKKAGKYLDYSQDADLVCICNPYDKLTEKYYRAGYLAEQGVPVVYIPYGYGVSKWYDYGTVDFGYLWKFFALTGYEKKQLLKNRYIRRKSIVVSGYPKMDSLAQYEKQERKRKKVIIAPHHTIFPGEINFSTFLQYADLWLELPGKYPEVDFVFRPHPLLKAQLLNVEGWDENKIDNYFKRISEIPNVEYQDGGNYMQTFVNSDALIHDCGSYMAEYLYTGKPALYLLKDEETNKKNFNPFAQKCIDCHHQAYKEEDIYWFLDEVVIAGNDQMKKKREIFFQKELKNKFPNVTEYIYTYILSRFNVI